MDQTSQSANSPDNPSGSLHDYIKRQVDGSKICDNPKEFFVNHFWKAVEGRYDELRATLLQYCQSKIKVPADYESRLKTPDSIKRSIERRELARMKDDKEPYNNLEDIRTDVHDLVGIRIIVDFITHLEVVNNWIEGTFNQEKTPTTFKADRLVGHHWTPWFGAYYCRNHHISVKTSTADYLEPYANIVFEIQVTCLSERLYNKLAHPLLYKGIPGTISRKDEMVIDIAHAMSLCYSMCLLYFQDSEDFEHPDLIRAMKKTVSASGIIDDEDSSKELLEQISKIPTFKPNIPLSYLSDNTSSKRINRQEVVSWMDDFRYRPISTDMTCTKIKTIVEEAMKDVSTPRIFLPEVPTARFDNKEVREAPRCHEHTRASIIDKIETWVNKPELGETMMWIAAPAGTGKSTLARSIAERCENRNMLAATYFFRRGAKDSHRNGTARLLPTIANQLAMNIPRFRGCLQQSLNDSYMKAEEADQRGLDIQFDTLIKHPLSALSNNKRNLMVVVIDAVDECDEAANIGQVIRHFSTLKERWLRLLFTSREAEHIHTMFKNIPHQPILLHEESKHETEKDIRVFLTYSFARIQAEKHIEGKWPQEDDINLVVHRATTPTPLFVYASTLLKYIHNEKGTINTVRKFKNWIKQCKNKQSQLGGLYTPIIEDALLDIDDDDDDDDDYDGNDKDDLRKLLGSIACVVSPLSAKTLSSLLCIDLYSIKHWLAKLHPVLHVPRDGDQPVTILHESFRDFLLTEDQSADQPVPGLYESHWILAEECMKRLSPGEDPYAPLALLQNFSKPQELGWVDICDDNIDLDVRVDDHLRYACHHWAYHWIESRYFDDNTCKKVEIHLRNNTFPWIETMSVMGQSEKAFACLDFIRDVIMDSHTEPRHRISELLTKARLFVFGQMHILDEFPLQTCLSALIFFPPMYDIKHSFCDIRIPFVRNITGDPTTGVPKLSRVISIFHDDYLPRDGGLLCATSVTNTALVHFPSGKINLYDLERGIFKRCYKLDDESVALAFHPDCRRFYSVSSEGRVDLWDIESGDGTYQCMLEECPLINKSAVSTNEPVVIAAPTTSLADHKPSIALWSMESGRRYGELQCGQFGRFIVDDMAFSPDGGALAVLSNCLKVHLWNVKTRTYLKTLNLSESGRNICFTPCGLWLLIALRESFLVWDYNDNSTQDVPINISSYSYKCFGINFFGTSYELLIIDVDTISTWDFSCLRDITRTRGCSGGDIDGFHDIDGLSLVNGRNLINGRNRIKAMALSPDEKVLATSSIYHSLLVWDIETMTRLFDIPDRGGSVAEAMVFSSDGIMLAVLIDNCVQIWKIFGNSRPTIVSTTQSLPVAFEPSKVYLTMGHPDEDRYSSSMLFPSLLPNGDMTIKIFRDRQSFIINTASGTCESGHRNFVTQTICTSYSWIEYTDARGCTRQIFYIPFAYRYHCFAPSGGRIAIGDVDGVFSILDLDLEELEKYSQNLTKWERLENTAEDHLEDD